MGIVSDYSRSFPKPNTPEWGMMNRVRHALIKKKIKNQLTDEERQLYDLLQEKSLQAIDAEFPFQPAPLLGKGEDS